MTQTQINVREILAATPPFGQLPAVVLDRLAEKFTFLRYRMGQAILVRETMPAQIAILYQGQARLLGYDPHGQKPVTLQLLQPGEVIGWVSRIRNVPCETVIASTETICLVLPAADFLALLEQEPMFAATWQNKAALIEVFDLLGAELVRQADGTTDLKQLAGQACADAVVLNLPAGKASLQHLDSDLMWLVSGSSISDLPVGSRLFPGTLPAELQVEGANFLRLLGFPKSPLFPTLAETESPRAIAQPWDTEIPFAPEYPARPPELDLQTAKEKYPYVQGRGTQDATLACFQMLCQHLGMPFRRDIIRRVLVNQRDRSGNFSLQFCGAVAELIGLSSQLVKVPASAVSRLQAPAMVAWQDSFAVLYKISDQELIFAVPETGIQRKKPAEFIELWGKAGEVLLLKPTKSTPQKRFGLSWFGPALRQHRKVLIEVLIASIFVQLLGLANPLMTQVIIDKVLVQNSIDTLSVLGIFLVVVAVVEAVLTNIRTHLFADTTNRIDLTLGSEVINHLLRLPLPYFEKRPVGELATRVSELERIRSFLTGTALTVVLDAVFSVIYIVVMAVYSWLLTLVALSTVPLFAILTIVVSPMIRQQSRVKAERNAETQSYLVEVVSGIQTVKAQNLELRSRWQWQDRYVRYISAGFKTISTSTTASTLSNFLNKLSSLLVLWAGAYFVLQGNLTLGQLIAFRIISGYVTSPLLRLVQLWQNFQETALSLERLSDILDTPQEADEADRRNILMPMIRGAVKYENVSFGFSANGPLQLSNVNLEFPPGTFVGIVGQSGSGKSTLMKLLPRLYEPKSGRIIIDGYDISKVELYSLRQQIGMVLQDTLLFDGTVQENIALTNPDASDEEIIAAAQVAYAHDFIMNLPNGYNTRVGERGAALSGGQRQRIAIARTVLQNPRILVLDEATSALDYSSERQVCTNLAEACRDRTVFFITHRLSTIRNADAILMMDRGSIVERGTHAELMALKGRYYCLYQQQEAQL